MPKYWNPFSKKHTPDEKLTEAQQLEKWKARFKNCSHKRRQDDMNWDRYASIMDDNLWRSGSMRDSGREPAQVNELKTCIMAVLPYIILEPPAIEIRTHSGAYSDLQMASIYEKVAEYINSKYDLFTEFMYGCYDALLYGNGIFKMGYWDDVLIDKPLWGSGLSEAFGTTRAAYAKQAPLTEIFPDYQARRWNEMRYLIHQVPMHIDDVLDNPAYKSTVTRKLVPTYSADQLYDISESSDDSALDKEYVKIQEIHDFRRGRVMVMAEGIDKWLYTGPEPYNIVPFENLMFWPRPKTLWGDSLTQSIEKHIKELSETMEYMNRTIAKEALLKVLYNPAMIGEVPQKKLENKSDEYIPVLVGAQGNLANALHVVDYGTSQSQYNFHIGIQELQEIIRKQSGVTAQERGVHEEGVETAVEARMLQSASSVRNTMRQRMFARFASRVISKLLYIVTLEYPPVKIAEMAGVDPSYAYTIAAAGAFDATKFKVDYGLTAVNSRQERFQKLVMFKNIVGEGFVNPASLAKMAADILDFDFTDEMMVYQALGQGQGPGSSSGFVQNAARNVANTRIEPSRPQSVEQFGGM